MSTPSSLVARVIEIETLAGQNGTVRAISRKLPGLAAEAADEAALAAIMPRAIREALMPEEACVALPVGRVSGAAGTWVAIPDVLVALANAA